MNEIKMSKYYFSNNFSEYETFINNYNIEKKYFKAKELVSSQHETLNRGYYIKKGILKLSIGSESGKEKILALFGPGSIFPLGINEHHYKLEYAITEQAFIDLEVYEFKFLELKKMFCNNQQFALKMMEHYCDFTSFLFYDISSLTSESTFIKTCNILYSLVKAEVFHKGFVKLGQNDVADLGGMSKIQVARAYQELKINGIIETKRNGILIKNIEGLRNLCSLDNME